jgi:FKBP-type peptidyl-prolyl cis-trans isomerase (trigger factor)
MEAELSQHERDAVTRHDLDNLEKAMLTGLESLRDHVDTRFTAFEDAARQTGEDVKRRQEEMNKFREEARKDAETYVRLDLYRTERVALQRQIEAAVTKLEVALEAVDQKVGEHTRRLDTMTGQVVGGMTVMGLGLTALGLALRFL